MKALFMYWRTYLLIISFTILGMAFHHDAYAQRDKWRFFWNVDEEYNEEAAIHLGIHFNYYHSHYTFEKNQNWDNLSLTSPNPSGQFQSIVSRSGHGLGLGIPVDYRINDRFNLTFSPTFVVLQGSAGGAGMEIEGFRLGYVYGNGIEEEKLQHLQSNFPAFDLPLHFKVRSEPKYFGNSVHPYKMYLLAGGKWTRTLMKDQYDLLDNNNLKELPLVFKKQHYSAEVGLGMDFIFTYFKLSPEIRFSQSIGNLLDTKTYPHLSDPTINPYMGALRTLGLRSFQFSLIFE